MIIVLIMILIGICIYLLTNYFFAYLKQKKVTRRLSGSTLVVYEKDKSLITKIKQYALKIGATISDLKYPVVTKYLGNINKLLTITNIQSLNNQMFAGIQILSGFGMIVLGIIIFNSFGILNILILFVLGFFMPFLWLKEKINKKQREIFRSLPDALDLLTLLVEAGVDFNSAINILIENQKNALTSELYQYQQEVKLGKNRILALLDLAAKLENKYLSSVISSITQTLQTGTPVAQTLKILSEQFRTERSIMAEKLGAQAPVKMMIPLILLIFPTIFIVIFAPIVLSFLGGGFW